MQLPRCLSVAGQERPSSGQRTLSLPADPAGTETIGLMSPSVARGMEEVHFRLHEQAALIEAADAYTRTRMALR